MLLHFSLSYRLTFIDSGIPFYSQWIITLAQLHFQPKLQNSNYIQNGQNNNNNYYNIIIKIGKQQTYSSNDHSMKYFLLLLKYLIYECDISFLSLFFPFTFKLNDIYL